MTNTELREKLEELIVEAKRQWQGGTNNIDGRIADHLIANGVTFAKDTNDSGNWISVKERLPEESGTHIVVALNGHAKEVTFVKWQKMNKMWNLIGARSYWKVTHWMPLPEPLKEE